MAQRRIDGEIERLYQLPPEAFTAARNALAKQAGADGAEVRGLAKPPVAAWAVNQLYWNRRPVYEALIEASEDVRRTHTAVLGGKKGDLRASGKAHVQAVEAALKATLAVLEERGHPATDATRQSIVTTLRAVPVEGERPGRLTQILQPGGFEMLAGLSTSAPPPRAAGRSPAPQKQKAPAAKQPAARPRDLKALARAREASARAARELREAEHVARRQEFEAARAAREAEKAASSIETARETLEAAKQALAEAEAAAASTARTRDTAERRSNEAERTLEAARARADAAAAALAKLTD